MVSCYISALSSQNDSCSDSKSNEQKNNPQRPTFVNQAALISQPGNMQNNSYVFIPSVDMKGIKPES